MVRLPEEQRASRFDIDQFLVRTPGGGEIPLGEAATVTTGLSHTRINRRNGKRIINVTADVDIETVSGGEIVRSLKSGYLDGLIQTYPGLTYSFEGEQADQRETMGAIFSGFGIAMAIIYMLLAILFRSYSQPFIIMIAIPFGMIGAVFGHLIMGYELSVVSLMGVVALSGVVVNDSLVLLYAVNAGRKLTQSPVEAVLSAGLRRFRPILLTSLTTFLGLAPMMFEASVQARYLAPIAISLGYGLLLATGLILLGVPAIYLIFEDVKNLFSSKKSPSQEIGEPNPTIK